MNFLKLYKLSSAHNIIKKDIYSRSINHSYLIISKDSIFLDAIGEYVAKEILCLSRDMPCDNCINCEKITHGNMVDVITYPKDDKNLVVEDIITIINDCLIRPMESDCKIYILKNFDKCTIQAQNKLLKTLEEPPKNVIFILTACNSLQVLPTIISRSKVIFEKPIERDSALEFLIENKIPNQDLLCDMSEGNITSALKLSQNKDVLQVENLAFDMLANLKSSKDILRFSSQIIAFKKDIECFLETIISILRDILIFGKNDKLNFQNKTSEYRVLSQMYTHEMVYKILSKVCKIYEKMEFKCNTAGMIDQLLLDILGVRFLCQK